MKVFPKTGIGLVLSVCLLIFSSFTPANAAPKLLSPTSGSTLPGSTVTFTWTANGAAVTDWALLIGTKVGDSSLYNSGNLSSGTLGKTASGIPTNGSTVWVRLQWRYTNGSWGVADSSYTTGTSSGSGTSTSISTTTSSASNSSTSNNGSGRPALLSPAAGSTLPGSTVTFTWTANGATLTDWALRIGTRQGDASLYNSGNLSTGTLARTASGIPTNGSTVWVRLQWRYTNGSWGVADRSYTTGTSSGSGTSTSTTSNNGSGNPALLSPAPGSTLPGSTTTLTWTANGASLTDWSLRIGTSQGDDSLFNSGNLSSGTLAETASGIPTNGTTVWVRLQWRYTDGTWGSTDAPYTTKTSSGTTTTSTSTTTSSTSNSSTSNDSSGNPALLSPTPGSTLPGSTGTFSWTANGAALTDWSLRIGQSAGSSDLYNSGNLPSGTLAKTVSGLPTNDWPVWVRLQWRYTDGTWGSTDVQYTGGTSSGSTSSPTTSSPSPTPSPSPSGSVYFVSTTGNDGNPGTQSSPFRTIKRGLGVLKPGNTLYVRGGTYWEFLHTHDGTKFPAGLSWSTPIKIVAYNGETVTLIGSIDIGKASPTAQYLIFDGINIDAANHPNAIAVNGGSHHIRFQNLEIKNPDVNGIELSNFNGQTTNIELIKLNIHHTGRSSRGHGIYIANSNNLIDGCILHDNYKYGLHIYNAFTNGSNFNVARNNDVYRNGLGNGGSGGISVGGDGNRIENNRVHDQIRGISLVDGYPRNSIVRNNTVYNHVGAGILDGGVNSTIENNTANNNVPNYWP